MFNFPTISGMMNPPVRFAYHSDDDSVFAETTASGIRLHIPQNPNAGINILCLNQQIVFPEQKDHGSAYARLSDRGRLTISISNHILYIHQGAREHIQYENNPEKFQTGRGRLNEFVDIVIDASNGKIPRLKQYLDEMSYPETTFQTQKRNLNAWFREVSGTDIEALRSENQLNCILDESIILRKYE